MNERFYPRQIMQKLEKWLNRREIYAIKGPRQSGKTTILKILKEKLEKEGERVVFLNFEDMDVLEAFNKNHKEYIKSFITEEGRYYFLMDEYHYVNEPGKKLKLLYDTFENVKFIVTGSSSLELSSSMAKFLVGRVFFFELLPFSFREFLTAKDERLAKVYGEQHAKILGFLSEGKGFLVPEDIFLKELMPLVYEYAIFGGYPEAIKAGDAETKREILKNIYDTYISKDVIEFLKFSDAFKYRDIIRILALSTGNLVNYEDICSASRSYYAELRRVLSMLSETYVIKILRPFYTKPRTEVRKAPKVYFFDLGLRNHIVENFSKPETRTDKGAVLENYALVALLHSFPETQINYWRSIAKAEVDFVIRTGTGIIPVEMKFQTLNKPKVTRSLISFIKTYKPERALVVTKDFWGERTINETSVKFVPVGYL